MIDVCYDYYMGIDPGLSGAIAVFQPAPKLIVEVFDMPTEFYMVNKKKKKQLDLYDLSIYFNGFRKARQPKLTTIENPHAMPGQGVTSMFNFGLNCGIIQGFVAAHSFPVKLVRPSVWKQEMGLTASRSNYKSDYDYKKALKEKSRELASALFPAFTHIWARKKDSDRAEALLLAYYGARLT